MKDITGDAGILLWGRIRSVAIRSGCKLEESRGLLRRSFRITGTDEQLLRCGRLIWEDPELRKGIEL